MGVDSLAVVAAPALTPIDIEELLIWVYRRQRADVVVDAGRGLHREEAAMDAVLLTASSACGCAAIERIQRLGVRVDGQGGCDALHEDAELVHEAVRRLPSGLAQMLVVRHARIGDRPPDMRGVRPKARPVPGRRGAVAVRYEPWDRARNYGACVVDWAPSQASIDVARWEYALWWEAMDRVGATLRIEGRLRRNWPVAPSAPRPVGAKMVLDFTQ